MVKKRTLVLKGLNLPCLVRRKDSGAPRGSCVQMDHRGVCASPSKTRGDSSVGPFGRGSSPQRPWMLGRYSEWRASN